MPVNEVMGEHIFRNAQQAAWVFGPVPETGPPELDVGEELLGMLARLTCLIPMQQARLQLMETLPEHQRTEQRRWLKNLEKVVTAQGIQAGFHQHNLRKAGYGRLSTTP